MRAKPSALLLTLLILVSSSAQLSSEQQLTRYVYTSTFILENRGGGSYNLTEEDVTIILFMNDTWHTVKILNSTSKIARLNTDDDGNSLAILSSPSQVLPKSKMEFSVSYEMQVSSRPKPNIEINEAGVPSDIPKELIEKWTSETLTFAVGDQSIKSLAEKLTSNETTVLGSVLKLLEWVDDNIVYANFETPRYPNETFTVRKGDCDDQSILLISMLRSVDIPAFLQVGVVFSDSIQGEKTTWGGHLKSEQAGIGWHGWAMVYIPPWGWVPIDLTLTKSEDPFSRIRESPEYGDFIVAAMNISIQDYIGDTRRTREELMVSELYVTSVDVGVRIKDSSGSSIISNHLLIGISAASFIAVAAAFAIIRRRR